MKTAKSEILTEAKALRRLPDGKVLDMIRLYADDFRDIITETARQGSFLHTGGMIRIRSGHRDPHSPRH